MGLGRWHRCAQTLHASRAPVAQRCVDRKGGAAALLPYETGFQARGGSTSAGGP